MRSSGIVTSAQDHSFEGATDHLVQEGDDGGVEEDGEGTGEAARAPKPRDPGPQAECDCGQRRGEARVTSQSEVGGHHESEGCGPLSCLASSQDARNWPLPAPDPTRTRTEEDRQAHDILVPLREEGVGGPKPSVLGSDGVTDELDLGDFLRRELRLAHLGRCRCCLCVGVG